MTRVEMSGTYQIAVSDQQSAVEISESAVERIIRETLTAEGVLEAEISVALVDDPTIHEVNRDHLDHDYPTDVISFLFEDEVRSEPGPRGPRGAGKRIEGEILVSGDTAVREAARFGWSPENELTLYLVHGLLHLCGYDDLTDEEQPIMRERERTVLALWGLKPHYDA